MKRLTLLFLLIFCGCSSVYVEPDEVSETSWNRGSIEYFPHVLPVQQKAANWCWAACLEGATRSLLRGHSSAQIVLHDFQSEFGERMFSGDFFDRGASINQIASVINGYRFQFHFEKGKGRIEYTFRSRVISGLPSVDQLRRINDKNHAVILAIPHHAVLLSRFEWEKSGSHKRINKLVVMDPWPRQGQRTINREAFEAHLGKDFVIASIVLSIEERAWQQR